MSTKLAVNWVFNAYDYRTKRSLHKICRWKQLLIHWTFCPGIVGFPFVKFENVKKQFVFQEQPEQLCTCLTLYGTFLCCSLHSNGVQVFYGGREHKTTILLSFWAWKMSERAKRSSFGQVAYILQIKRNPPTINEVGNAPITSNLGWLPRTAQQRQFLWISFMTHSYGRKECTILLCWVITALTLYWKSL